MRHHRFRLRSFILVVAALALSGPSHGQPPGSPSSVRLVEVSSGPADGNRVPGLVLAPSRAVPPLIDGQLDDWEGEPQLSRDGARFWLAWDPATLYFAGEVDDGSLVSAERSDRTSTDAVLLRIADVTLFLASSRQDRPIAKLDAGRNSLLEMFHLKGSVDGLRVAVWRAEDHGTVRYEAAISWSLLDPWLDETKTDQPLALTVRDRRGDTLSDLPVSTVRGEVREAGLSLRLVSSASDAAVARLASSEPLGLPGQPLSLVVKLAASGSDSPPQPARAELVRDGEPLWSGVLEGPRAGGTAYRIEGVSRPVGSASLELRIDGRPANRVLVTGFSREAVLGELRSLSTRLEKLDRDALPEALDLQLAGPQYLVEHLNAAFGRPEISAAAATVALSLLDEAVSGVRALEAGQAPQAGRSGTFLTAHRSALDGTLQPYWMHVPASISTPATTLPAPLLVVLPDRDEDHNGRIADSRLIDAADRYGYVLAVPFGRSSEGTYRGPSRVEVLETLTHATTVQSLDPERRYLAGIGSAGTAALEIALQRPDRFAGVGAVSPLPDLRVEWSRRHATEPLSWLSLLFETRAASGYVRNAREMPVYLALAPGHQTHHAEQLASFARSLRDSAARLNLTTDGEVPVTDSPWDAMLSHFESRRDSRDVGRIEFVTYRLDTSSAWWVSIHGVRVYGQESVVRAERLEEGLFSLELQNVKTLGLNGLAAGLLPGTPVAISVDSSTVSTDLPGDGRVLLVSEIDGWRAVESFPISTHPEKSPGIEGPIGDVFTEPFLFVYADDGPGSVEAARAAHVSAARWEADFSGRAMVRGESTLTEEDERARHLFLFGTPENSPRLREIVSLMPVALTTGMISIGDAEFSGRTLGLQFVAPNPRNSSKYLLVVTGVGPGALELLCGHDWRKPDWIVVDDSYVENAPTSALGAGFFTLRWEP